MSEGAMADERPFTERAEGAWNAFWFYPASPQPLAAVRVLTAVLGLALWSSYATDLQRWFGPGEATTGFRCSTPLRPRHRSGRSTGWDVLRSWPCCWGSERPTPRRHRRFSGHRFCTAGRCSRGQLMTCSRSCCGASSSVAAATLFRSMPGSLAVSEETLPDRRHEADLPSLSLECMRQGLLWRRSSRNSKGMCGGTALPPGGFSVGENRPRRD